MSTCRGVSEQGGGQGKGGIKGRLAAGCSFKQGKRAVTGARRGRIKADGTLLVVHCGGGQPVGEECKAITLPALLATAVAHQRNSSPCCNTLCLLLAACPH
jgi:hypothetical protein